jgi:hypothetical protein
VTCTHPECTGVHDNNRWAELCPRSRTAKRRKDARWQLRHPDKVFLKNQRHQARRRVEALGEIGISIESLLV